MLKAVIFDIDDTLYSFRDAHRQAMEELAPFVREKLGILPEDFQRDYQRFLAFQMEVHGDVAGCHSRTIRFQLMLEERHLPLRWAPELSDRYWNAVLGAMCPNPGVTEFVAALQERGICMGVGTDMTADWQMKKLLRLGLLDKLNFVVTSEEAGVEKPEPELFQLCARKARCLPEECLFIGDNLKKDVLGAQAAGMQALWFQPRQAAPDPFSIVKSIPTFEGLIEHIF